MTLPDRDRLSLTALRMLAVDAVERANSGHPGLPLGAAPMAYVLWTRIMRHNPVDPAWPGRDRFILSAGHGSALLYALLHLSGYPLSLEEVQNFRQWGSKTPGHPEYGHTPGVEATTGPLGQGIAMAAGMAYAERHLANEFNQPGLPLVDHTTYAIVSDGDLMEGVAAEAASLAGTMGLGKLICLYDDNKISIEGSTGLAFTEDVGARFAAYGWQVLRVADGEDLDAIEAAVRQGQAESARPTLIVVRTHIGAGSPKQDDAGVHGSPLKGADMAATRAFYQWPEERFHIPAEVGAHFRARVGEPGATHQAAWQALLERCRQEQPALAARFSARMAGELPEGWDAGLDAIDFGASLATRSASGKVLNALAPNLPALLGGSADLAPSNNTWLKAFPERNIHFGVREHAMGAMVNGMALHGGLIPYCGTFLVFSDYMRGAIRLSALMNTHVVYVLTHDSIAVGEDGPTHQPVEHVASLRAIPNLTVFRPADGHETAAAWYSAIATKGPTALVLSRQNLPTLPANPVGVARGAYVAADCESGQPDLLLLASGSEVHLAIQAQERLCREGTETRVISMPSWERFLDQPRSYRDEVLPPAVKARLALEAGSSLGWHRWVGDQGDIIAVDTFGASAPGDQAMRRFGFSVENVVERAVLLLRRVD